MTFLYPAFLAGAIAIALPIVLHLLRRDVAPEVPFTAVRLLRRTPLEQTRRRRLRELLLLAARVAALLLVAGAFARPYLTAGAAAGLHVVAIDRSYSMGAPGRFERALAIARESIGETRSGERVAVIAFDDRAEVVAPPGTASAARAALEGLRPGFGGTRFAAAIARATELAELAPARMVIVSDMQRAGWEDAQPITIPSSLEIATRDAGSTPANLAVTAVTRDAGALVAVLRNSGAAPVSGAARVVLDGRVVASAAFTAAPGSSTDLRIPYRPPDTGTVAIAIDDAGGYPADDRRFAILDAAVRTSVLLITADADQSGFYLSRALKAGGPDEAIEVRTRASPVPGPAAAGERPPDVIVLLSTRSLDRRGRDMVVTFVRAGGGLVVAASPDVDAAVLSGMMEWPELSAAEGTSSPGVLAATDLRHPIFRPFGSLAANLGQVSFARAWRVRETGWDVAARFTDGSPALLERREGKGRVLLFASDVDRRWSDFPLHAAFVPFTVEAVRHAAASRAARRDYVVAHVPPGVPGEPGGYRSADGRPIAVNVDVREGATAKMTGDEFMARISPVERTAAPAATRRAQQAEGQQSLWRYGLLLMLGTLVVESLVGRVR